MAKSPVGGSRSFLKGKLGSDVYALGKDGKGKRQQVVRSLAEEVANPRSTQQMAGRMVMSTVMQAVKFLNPIIDHSFDGVVSGQPSISKFISENYAILKTGVGVYNEYQEKGIKPNALIVSGGKAKWPSSVFVGMQMDDNSPYYGEYGVHIVLSGDAVTVGDLKTALLQSASDFYVTVISLFNGVGASKAIIRYRINEALTDETVITSNMETLFVPEILAGVSYVKTNVSSGANAKTYILLSSDSHSRGYGQGAILSEKRAGKWIHSASQLVLASTVPSNYAAALATYPIGTEQFLNGGSI